MRTRMTVRMTEAYAPGPGADTMINAASADATVCFVRNVSGTDIIVRDTGSPAYGL